MGLDEPGGSMSVTQLTEKFTKAFDYARVVHVSDVRKGTDDPVSRTPHRVAAPRRFILR